MAMVTWVRLAKGTVAGALLLCAGATAPAGAQGAFVLNSPDVHAGARFASAQIFNGMGCTGGNVSPALVWRAAPAATRSFAVTSYDPDAPTWSGWWHWVVFNIPASTTSIPMGAGDVKKKLMPKGAIQSRTDFGTDGYGGPCPPQGDKPHHYIFTVYAVDEDKLQFAKDHNVSAAVVGFELHFHSKAKASLTATYGR